MWDFVNWCRKVVDTWRPHTTVNQLCDDHLMTISRPTLITRPLTSPPNQSRLVDIKFNSWTSISTKPFLVLHKFAKCGAVEWTGRKASSSIIRSNITLCRSIKLLCRSIMPANLSLLQIIDQKCSRRLPVIEDHKRLLVLIHRNDQRSIYIFITDQYPYT